MRGGLERSENADGMPRGGAFAHGRPALLSWRPAEAIHQHGSEAA